MISHFIIIKENNLSEKIEQGEKENANRNGNSEFLRDTNVRTRPQNQEKAQPIELITNNEPRFVFTKQQST